MANRSCDRFSIDTSSTIDSDLQANLKKTQYNKKKLPYKEDKSSAECFNLITSSSSTSSTMMSIGAYNNKASLIGSSPVAPNICYEVDIAKSILKQYSTLSGDNMFDHLSDIVKRIIDERPPNVIDFFEEFSRNVREQKFHVPERFPQNAVFADSRMFRPARTILQSLKLPQSIDGPHINAEELLEEEALTGHDNFELDINDNMRFFITFNERVQQLQFYWNQVGFSIAKNDIFQLTCAINRLQAHPSIRQCRFWGCINGLKKSYYIVEASLTQEEIVSRLSMMEEEMREKQIPLKMRNDYKKANPPSHIGPELTPGVYGWDDYPLEELKHMLPKAEAVPIAEEIEYYDIPPEFVGQGCNRYSYFVVNNLYDDWIELPIVTPRQIVISRQIKKFLTGDLEANIISYPCFPGKEKHYLRALIARITSGTHVAPRGYYRRMTKKEQRLFDGIPEDGELEEEEEEENYEGEETELDNDVMLVKNEQFELESLSFLALTEAWVHCRPNILNQGRIVWYDEEKARKDRERALALYLKKRLLEEMEDEIDDEEIEEEEAEEEMLDEFNLPEIGPNLLSACSNDISGQCSVPWQVRFTSKYTNPKERMLVMQSNLWKGAFTFIFENTCESIYLGWGHKYCRRNHPFMHLPKVQEEFLHGPEDFIESADPSVEDELAYKEWLLNKQRKPDIPGEGDLDYEDYDVEDQNDEA